LSYAAPRSLRRGRWQAEVASKLRHGRVLAQLDQSPVREHYDADENLPLVVALAARSPAVPACTCMRNRRRRLAICRV